METTRVHGDPPSTVPEISDLITRQIEVVQGLLHDNDTLRWHLRDLATELSHLRMAIARGVFKE
jgi:hypothetical protein